MKTTATVYWVDEISEGSRPGQEWGAIERSIIGVFDFDVMPTVGTLLELPGTRGTVMGVVESVIDSRVTRTHQIGIRKLHRAQKQTPVYALVWQDGYQPSETMAELVPGLVALPDPPKHGDFLRFKEDDNRWATVQVIAVMYSFDVEGVIETPSYDATHQETTLIVRPWGDSEPFEVLRQVGLSSPSMA